MGLDFGNWDIVGIYFGILCAFQFVRLFVYYIFLRKVIVTKPLKLSVNDKGITLKIGPLIKSLQLTLIPVALYGLMLLIFIPSYDFQRATSNYAFYIMSAVLLISVISEILYFRKLHNAEKWILKYLMIIGISIVSLFVLGMLFFTLIGVF